MIPQYYIAHPYCAQLSHKLTCAYDRVHIDNVRAFSQAKLESKTNTRFQLNEYSDLYFLLHNFAEQIILCK